jgi:hypothetical protein
VDVSEAEALSSKVRWVDKLQSSSQSSSSLLHHLVALSSQRIGKEYIHDTDIGYQNTMGIQDEITQALSG